MASETTTIKLTKKTKLRLDKLKEYKRETYDEILEKMLEILTLCRINPERARSRLLSVSRKQRHEKRKTMKKQPSKTQTKKSS